MRLLLPLLIPLGVLAIGSWRLMAEAPAPLSADPARPSLAQRRPFPAPPPASPAQTCSQNPNLSDALLREGSRLGITVRAGEPELPGKDASYRAIHGRLGTITLKQRPMSAVVRCKLISHEFIHVLQHLQGDLKGVPPLGWTVTPAGVERFGALQEAEAYRYQDDAGHVLKLLRATPKP